MYVFNRKKKDKINKTISHANSPITPKNYHVVWLFCNYTYANASMPSNISTKKFWREITSRNENISDPNIYTVYDSQRID